MCVRTGRGSYATASHKKLQEDISAAVLGGLVLQDLKCLGELVVYLNARLLHRSGSSGCRPFLIWGLALVGRGRDHYVGRDAIVLQLLAGGRFILGDGEDQGCAVWQLEGLLLRALAKGLLADFIGVLVVNM